MSDAQQRVMAEQQTRMREAHAAAQRTKAGTDAVPAPAADADRRIDAIAERYYAEPRRGPRIRGL
jgi:uncharacterized membrane protein